MEKIKSKWNELNDFAERSNDNFTGWCKDKINYNIIFYVIQFLMVVIGVFTFYKYKSDFGDYIYIYLLNLFSSIILIKFEYYKLRFFDLLFNALFIVAYIILQICTFITIDTLFIVYFFYKIIICILLCIISNDKIKNWLKNSSNRKVYITANMFYCIMLFIYYYVYENNLGRWRILWQIYQKHINRKSLKRRFMRCGKKENTSNHREEKKEKLSASFFLHLILQGSCTWVMRSIIRYRIF